MTKTDFDTKLQDISNRITSNKSKQLLVEKEVKKLRHLIQAIYRDRNRFEEDGVQNYLVFQQMYNYFKKNWCY